MRRSFLAALLAAVVGLPAGVGHAAQPADELRARGPAPADRPTGESVLLRAGFTAGDTYYLEANAEINQLFTGGIGGEINMRTRALQTRGVLVKVESTSPTEGTVLTLTFDRVSQQIRAMDHSWGYDSDAQQGDVRTNMVGRTMSPMVGKRIRMTIDAAGNAVALEGMQRILDDMEVAALGDATSTQFFHEAKHNLTDRAMKFMWGDSRLVLYPNRPVSVGQTWEKTLREPVPFVGEVIRTYTCKLDRIETHEGHKIAMISYQATMVEAPDAISTLGPNNTMVAFRDGYVRGAAAIDVERGALLTQTEQVRNENVMEAPMMNDPAASQQLFSDRTFSITYRAMTLEQRQAQKRQKVGG